MFDGLVGSSLANTKLYTSGAAPALISAALAPQVAAASLLAEAVGETFVRVAAAHRIRLHGVTGEIDLGAGGDVRGADIAIRAIWVEAICVDGGGEEREKEEEKRTYPCWEKLVVVKGRHSGMERKEYDETSNWRCCRVRRIRE